MCFKAKKSGFFVQLTEYGVAKCHHFPSFFLFEGGKKRAKSKKNCECMNKN